MKEMGRSAAPIPARMPVINLLGFVLITIKRYCRVPSIKIGRKNKNDIHKGDRKLEMINLIIASVKIFPNITPVHLQHSGKQIPRI